MIKKTYRVLLETGIHARTSTILVNIASKYEASAFLIFKNKTINLKSIMGVMSLEFIYGDTFDILLDGKDEEMLFEELSATIYNEKIGKEI